MKPSSELSPFATHLGMEIVEKHHGKIVLSMTPAEFTRNRRGGLHGGVISTLLDTTLGLAASSTSQASESVVTVNLEVSFLAPPRGKLKATGLVVKGGRSLIFCRGEVVDSTDSLVAVGSATMKIVK